MRAFSIGKIWFRVTESYGLVGSIDRDVKHLGRITTWIIISKEGNITVEFECDSVPEVNKEYNNVKDLEEAEKIILEYFEKLRALRGQLSKQLRLKAEQEYKKVINRGYLELLKEGKFEI